MMIKIIGGMNLRRYFEIRCYSEVLMKHSIILAALLSFGVTGLAGCATATDEPASLADKLETRNYLLGEEVDRIRNYRINGWNHVDDWHVIITAGVREKYLLSLRNRCPELRSASHMAFSTTAGNLTDFDEVMVTGPGGFVDHCYIDKIYKLAKKPVETPDQR